MLHLTVVTPERSFLKEDSLAVTLPGKTGEMQILSGHIPLLAELKAGIMSIEKSDRSVVRFMIGEGVVEINDDNINVLCEQALHQNEIDKDFELNLLTGLQDQIKQHEADDKEQSRLFAELSRCTARLSLFE